MKLSVDGKFEGPKGVADWVVGWSDDYDMMSQIDACVVGGAMYPGHEWYWTTILQNPDQPIPGTDTLPTPGEIEWARFATRVPHYVLSSKRQVAEHDIRPAHRRHRGPQTAIGGRTVTTLMHAGLVDELQLIIYPLISGGGKPLFEASNTRHRLELRKARQLADGRMSLVYETTKRRAADVTP